MSRVLIAGCGYLGSALGEHLARGRHQIVAIRREPTPSARFQSVALDLRNRRALRAWLGDASDFDAVACTVAAGAGDEASYREGYVDAFGALVDSLRSTQANPPLLLFTSSTSVYPQDRGEWVDEETATAPSGFRGRVQLEAEELLASWPGAHCSLRLGGLYGPGRTRLAASVRDGRAVAERTYTNRIHRDDAAGSLAHLVACHSRGDAIPPTLLGVDDEPALRSEVVRWLAARLGLAAPPLKAGATRGKRCRNNTLRETGYTLRFASFRKGYASLLGTDPSFPTFAR